MSAQSQPSFAVSNKTLAELKPDSRNANKGTPRGQKMIADSLKTYGAGRSILLDKHGAIIAGNKTAENAESIGMRDVIVVPTDGTKLVAVQRMDLDLADPKAKQLAIADNRSSEISLEWDFEVLKELAGEIDLAPFWNADELEAMWPHNADLLTDEDDVPEVPAEPVTKPGDLYILGKHRLLCGDSTVIADVERLMNGENEAAIVSDPPYGVGVDYRDFEDSRENVAMLIKRVMSRILAAPCAVLTPGIPSMWLYPQPVWLMAWIHPAPNGGCPWGFAGVNPILAYGADPYLKAGRGRRPDSLVQASDREGVSGHPTPKPMKVWEWLVNRVGPRGRELILDLFGGSGTTMIACEKTNRRCYMMELSPAYCDVIVTRWQNATGKKAMLDGATT